MGNRTEAYSPRYDDYPSAEYPPDWQARRQRVLRRDDYRCQGCGIESTRVDDVRFDVDHVVPKSDGGTHATENLQTLCPSCHADKHPGNTGLKRRGRAFDRRNQPGLLTRVLRSLLGPFVDSVGPDERTVLDDRGRKLRLRSLSEAATLPEGTGVTVRVSVTELWETDSETVHQMGRLRDATPDGEAGRVARFVVWHGYGHPRLQQGQPYRLVGAETNVYDEAFQLVVDGQTVIQRV